MCIALWWEQGPGVAGKLGQEAFSQRFKLQGVFHRIFLFQGLIDKFPKELWICRKKKTKFACTQITMHYIIT